MVTLHWCSTACDRPTPPRAWNKKRPEWTWELATVTRPYGHYGVFCAWHFELRPPDRDEYSAEWLMQLERAA